VSAASLKADEPPEVASSRNFSMEPRASARLALDQPDELIDVAVRRLQIVVCELAPLVS